MKVSVIAHDYPNVKMNSVDFVFGGFFVCSRSPRGPRNSPGHKESISVSVLETTS